MKRFFLLSICALTACSGGDVKETLGLNRQAPDEFRVVARPPLSVPPDFNNLPQPSIGSEDHISQQRADREAQRLITGADSGLKPGKASTAVQPVTAKSLGGKTKADAQFLQRAGAGQADPNARAELYRETAGKQQEQPGIVDKLTTLPDKKEPLVDAKKEAERLRQNQAKGKPVTEGDTPETKAADTGILGRMFGY